MANKSIDGTTEEYYDKDRSHSDTTIFATKAGDWAVEFSYGVITVVAKCSTTNDNKEYGQIGNPGNATGKHCWCKMRELKKQNEGKFQEIDSSWALQYSFILTKRYVLQIVHIIVLELSVPNHIPKTCEKFYFNSL